MRGGRTVYGDDDIVGDVEVRAAAPRGPELAGHQGEELLGFRIPHGHVRRRHARPLLQTCARRPRNIVIGDQLLGTFGDQGLRGLVDRVDERDLVLCQLASVVVVGRNVVSAQREPPDGVVSVGDALGHAVDDV